MMAHTVIWSWLVIVNVTWIALFLYAALRLPRTRERTIFLSFLVPYSVWANCLLAIHLTGAEHPISRFLSQSIFAGGAAFHVIIGTLLILLADPRRLKKIECRAFILNTVVVGVLSYAGLWENGVFAPNGKGLAPVPSKYLWYFNVSLLGWGLYYFLAIVSAYRRLERRDLLRCQLKVLTAPAVISVSLILCTNVVIPGITGNYTLTAIGGFWLFGFFAAIAYVIRMGHSIILLEAVREFEASLTSSDWDSIDAKGDLVRSSILRTGVLMKGDLMKLTQSHQVPAA